MKLIVNNMEFEITLQQAENISKAYEDKKDIFPINGNIFFRGAITNSYILSDAKSEEKELARSEKELKAEIETYEKAVTAEDRRFLREKNERLNQYIIAKKKFNQSLKI